MNLISSLIKLGAFLLMISCSPPLTGTSSAITEVSGFGSNPGNLKMFTHAGSGATNLAPLVVALHGCGQNSALYLNAGWSDLADKYHFHVLYPQQQVSNDPNLCFQWWSAANNARNSGEALSIKQMVDYMKASYSIDSTKIYVTGLSGGGAMTSVMLAAYPDVFAAGSINAGVPYGCATLTTATQCTTPGTTQTAVTWGNLVRNADAGYAGPYPKVSIWQGDADPIVAYANAAELMKQWTNVSGASQTPSVADTVKGYPHNTYKVGGVSVVETYQITGGTHAIFVDPGLATDQGGRVFAFFINAGIFSSYYAAKFWGLVP